MDTCWLGAGEACLPASCSTSRGESPPGETGPVSLSPVPSQPRPQPPQRPTLTGGRRHPRACYLHTVFTFEALATVVGHLVADEVGLPVEGLGTLVTLVFPLLRVDDHVLFQAAQRGQGSLQRPPARPLPSSGWPSNPRGMAAPPALPAQRSERVVAHVCPPPSGRVTGWRGRDGPYPKAPPAGPQPTPPGLSSGQSTLKLTLGLRKRGPELSTLP